MIKLLNINQRPYGCLRNDWEEDGIPSIHRLVYSNVLDDDVFSNVSSVNIQRYYRQHLDTLRNKAIINSLRSSIQEKLNKSETFKEALMETGNSRIIYRTNNEVLFKIYGEILTDIKFDYFKKNTKLEDKTTFNKFVALKGLEYAFRFENLEEYMKLKTFSDVIKALVSKYGNEKIYSLYNPDLIFNINKKIGSDEIYNVQDAIKFIQFYKYKEIININNNHKKNIIFESFVKKMEQKYKKKFNVKTDISQDIKNLFLDLDFKLKSELVNKVNILYQNGKIKVSDTKLDSLYFPTSDDIKKFSYYNLKKDSAKSSMDEIVEIDENSILSPLDESCVLREYKFPSISYNMLFNYCKELLHGYLESDIINIFKNSNGQYKKLDTLEYDAIETINNFYNEKEEFFYKKFLEDKFLNDDFKYMLESSLYDFEYVSDNPLEKNITESFFYFIRHDFIKNSFVENNVSINYNRVTSDRYIIKWKHRKISYICFCIDSFNKYMLFKDKSFVLNFNKVEKLIFSLFPCYKNFKIVHDEHYMSRFVKMHTKKLFPNFEDLNKLNKFLVNCVESLIFDLIKIINTSNIYALKFAIYQCENFANTKMYDLNSIFNKIKNILYENGLIHGNKIERYELQFISSLINFKNRFDWFDIYSEKNLENTPPKDSIQYDSYAEDEDLEEEEVKDTDSEKSFTFRDEEDDEIEENNDEEYNNNDDDFYGIVPDFDNNLKELFDAELTFTNNNIFNIVNIIYYYDN